MATFGCLGWILLGNLVYTVLVRLERRVVAKILHKIVLLHFEIEVLSSHYLGVRLLSIFSREKSHFFNTLLNVLLNADLIYLRLR